MVTHTWKGNGGKPAGPVENETVLSAFHADFDYAQAYIEACIDMYEHLRYRLREILRAKREFTAGQTSYCNAKCMRGKALAIINHT